MTLKGVPAMETKNQQTQSKNQQAQSKPFECFCGATFFSKREYQDHQKTHSQGRRAASAVANPISDQKPDAQRPREQGQTEEERHKWNATKNM
jgi:hypothetical protein